MREPSPLELFNFCLTLLIKHKFEEDELVNFVIELRPSSQALGYEKVARHAYKFYKTKFTKRRN